MNKDEWLKDVDNTYNDLLNYVEEIESQPGNAGINGTEVENIVDSATESLQQFFIDFNLKCGLGSVQTGVGFSPPRSVNLPLGRFFFIFL